MPTIAGILIPGVGPLKYALRRKATGTAALRPILNAFETRFGDVIAYGGIDRRQVLSEPNQANAQALRNAREVVIDKKLRAACDAVQAAWNGVFAAAPAAPIPEVINLNDHDPPERVASEVARLRMVERQFDAARIGQEAVERARTRANALDRRIAGMT